MSTIDLGYRPRPWQTSAHLGMADRRWSVLVAHRRSGKTVLAVMQLIDKAIRFTPPEGGGPGRFAYVAPLLAQAKAIAWDYVKRYTRSLPGVKINESELWVELSNGSRIRLHGADNPDALRGIYLDGVVLDEFADIRAEVWGEIIRPLLADRGGWALVMGTPKGINAFSEMYYKAQESPHEWYTGKFTVNDTDSLPASEVEDARKSMSSAQFAQEFLCDFSAGNASALLSADEVETACKRHYRESDYQYSPKILGVDVARQGDDSTALVRRQGLVMFPVEVVKGANNMDVAGMVARVIRDWQPDAVFIDGSGGYGAGVIDILRNWKHRITEVQFGSKATDPRYANKRSEMWCDMAKWIKEGGALPPDVALKRDLCGPRYNHRNARGLLALESKDEIKKRGMPSPDRADALALCFAHPVAAQGIHNQLGMMISGHTNTVTHEYNPLSAMM